MKEMQFRVQVGLLILAHAFMLSFWDDLGIGIDLGEGRIIFLYTGHSSE